MPVAPEKRNSLNEIFGSVKPLIGNVHCLPLPGAPKYRNEQMHELIERAIADARNYAMGGMDGLLIENHGDIPFVQPHEIGHETVAALTVIAKAVGEETGLPFGISLLANCSIGALAVAKASGARFIRVNQWVNAYVSNEGLIQGESGKALRYRRSIGAENVAIFADVHVKHGAHAIVADRPVSEQASDVEFYEADVAIATGNRTGDAVPDSEIEEIRSGTRLPIIAGSGVTVANASQVLARTDGAIIGSSLKRDGMWWNEVELSRVKALVATVHEVRGRAAKR
ncbi:MAG: BtpA/SgcQ family protein [Trueperaceae bacterium]